MQHARAMVRQDQVPWTVAVDTLAGATHKAYGTLPNSVYLIDRSGRVAFRALWAGQEGLLRDKIVELLEHQSRGEEAVNLGQEENIIIPFIHGAAEFDRTMDRAGERARKEFRSEMGNLAYGLEKLASKLRPLVNRNEDEIPPSLLKGIAAGVVGGIVGAFLMDRFQTVWEKTGSRVQAIPETEQIPATVKAAQAISQGVFNHELEKSRQDLAGEAVHYAMGAVSGGIYGAVSELAPNVTSATGMPFGANVWLIADEITVPAVGLSKAPMKYPASTHVYGLLSHIIFGVTTESTRWLLRRTIFK